jgi:tetratricopeptide (TPR) repeat protein
MFAHLSRNLLVAGAAILLVLPSAPELLEAQDGSRARIVVPNIVPTDDSRDRFGQRVADNVRDIFNLDRSVALSERDLDQAARRFEMRYRDLDCLSARQLAAQIDANLILCADYHQVGDQFEVTPVFYTVTPIAEYPLEPFRVAANDDRGTVSQAGQAILERFQELEQRLQQISWCQQNFASSNWNDAKNFCSRAVELTPESYQARFLLARTHFELEEWEQALEHFEVLIEENPHDDDVLNNLGYVSAQLGDRQRARSYYLRYLEMNPTDVNVRMSVAYDLSTTGGDPEGGMALLEAGLEQEPDNIDLHEAYGAYAFTAATTLQAEQPQAVAQDGDTPALSPEVAEMYRKAIRSLEIVFEERGAETRTSYVRNIMRAYRQLGDLDSAIRMGEQASNVFTEDAQILSELSNAYNADGNVDGAIRALERALEINPELPQAHYRKGIFLLQAGREDDAIRSLKAAEAAAEQPSDQLALPIFARAFQNYIQNEQNLDRGIELLREAKTFSVTEGTASQFDYFLGYAIYQRAVRMAAPENLQSARASKPVFEEARRYVQAGRPYAEAAGQNFQQILDAIAQYIEIQDAIIAREGRR